MAVPLDSLLILLVVAAAAVGVGVLAWIFAKVAARLAAKTGGTFDDLLAKALSGPLAMLAALVAAVLGLYLVAGRVGEEGITQSRRLVAALFIVLAAWGLLRVLRVVLERASQRRARLAAPARVGRRIVALALFSFAFLMILSTYGLSITPVLTGLGIAGLAVALALQDTGANFFAGIWIQTGRSMEPGHYVKVEGEQGLEGYVEEVGWRVTRIRTLGGNTIVVPNNKLAQSIVTDFDLPQKDMSVVMTFRTGLESDPKQVIGALVDEAKAAYKELPASFQQDKQPFAQLSDYEEYCQRYSLIIRVPEFVQQWNAQDLVRKKVLERFRKDGIRIPYPTRHNFQEPVEPGAVRIKGAPGGLAPRGRPKPRARREEPSEDPRTLEADQARKEIRDKQRRQQAGEPKSG